MPWCVSSVYPFKVELTDEELEYGKSLAELAKKVLDGQINRNMGRGQE